MGPEGREETVARERESVTKLRSTFDLLSSNPDRPTSGQDLTEVGNQKRKGVRLNCRKQGTDFFRHYDEETLAVSVPILVIGGSLSTMSLLVYRQNKIYSID